MIDRYTKVVLTFIAFALVYLCVIFTPLPRAHAQAPSKFPGEPSGPTEVVVVGWQTRDAATVPVTITHPVQVTSPQPLRITGQVTTEQPPGVADRVLLVGWEEYATTPRYRKAYSLGEDGLFGSRPVPVRVATK